MSDCISLKNLVFLLFFILNVLISNGGKLYALHGLVSACKSSAQFQLFYFEFTIPNKFSISIEMKVHCPTGVSVRLHIITSCTQCHPHTALSAHHLTYSTYLSFAIPPCNFYSRLILNLKCQVSTKQCEGCTDAKRPLANIHPSSSSSAVFHISQRICTLHKKLISAAKLFLFGQVQIETI